jgi:hypothetical protein
MNSLKSNNDKKNKTLNPKFKEFSSEYDNSLSQVQFIFTFDGNCYSRDTFCLQLNLYRFYKVSNLYAGKIAVYDLQNGSGRRAEDIYPLYSLFGLINQLLIMIQITRNPNDASLHYNSITDNRDSATLNIIDHIYKITSEGKMRDHSSRSQFHFHSEI